MKIGDKIYLDNDTYRYNECTVTAINDDGTIKIDLDGGENNWHESDIVTTHTLVLTVVQKMVIAKYGDVSASAMDNNMYVAAHKALDRLEDITCPLDWLSLGKKYYYPALDKEKLYSMTVFSNSAFDAEMLRKGLMFPSVADAVAMAFKMLGVIKHEV